jgi:hypothetical protein
MGHLPRSFFSASPRSVTVIIYWVQIRIQLGETILTLPIRNAICTRYFAACFMKGR